MERLRSPGGCPWDRAQSFATIAPYTIEEAYEVADAIERDDLAGLKDELGDLLFQVVFHAAIAREAGAFDFDAVAEAIAAKLERRHPHVFGGEPVAGVLQQTDAWERIKAAERDAAAGGPASLVDGVPLALPALARTHKLGRRAARAGFDFPDAASAAGKVREELAEVLDADARERERPERIAEEVGDLLFAAANLARKLGVEPEAALRAANAKFERRIRRMERFAADQDTALAALGLDAQEALWNRAKREE
ncbi:MAG: nucleoside triphosphate pyrophosphohydrolase [Gammaproteobacteria bacterium]|nr:nucleoside triphosphate pyrophosphohydrolase [Gammaproteobacteria bacterium]